MSHKCQSVLCDSNGRPRAELASVSADFEDGQVIPEHSHPEDQLLFASEGVMTLSTKQGVWVVPPLRAVWIPANTPHSVAMSGQVSMRTLYFLPKLCRAFGGKCLVMNISALPRELILYVCKIKKLQKRTAGERRIVGIIVEQLKSVESVPLQLPHPSDSRAMRVVRTLLADPADHRTLRKAVRGLRRKQENDSARIPGGNKNAFRPMAAAASSAACFAAAGLRGKSDRRRSRGGI